MALVRGGEKLGADSSADPSVEPSVEPNGDSSADSSSDLEEELSSLGVTGSEGDGPLDDRTDVAGGAVLRAVVPVEAGMVLADRYQIEAPLGEGGSGIVYRAWDRLLAEPVAIKILHPQRARERSWIKRLAREVKVARAIGHPNVCRVFELGHADGHWFVTMELATGGSLRDMLRNTIPPQNTSGGVSTHEGGRPRRDLPGGTRSLADRLRDIRELCAGLGAMHAVAITHRDVTPQNVLRMADGRLVLTDFGLAIEQNDQTTMHGGTPAYMPPEAARGERSDQRSDVFQLGMIMHEVLTGIRPTWTPDGARLKLIEPVPGASAVEEELSRLVADCVNPDPALRPPSAVAVAGRLAAAEVARPAPLPVRLFTRTHRFARRHPRLMVAAAVAVGLAVVARSVQVLSRPPLCKGAAQQLAGIWDQQRSEAVRRAFAASGKSYAADAFAHVQVLLDTYARSWARMYTDACEATHLRGEQSADVLDLRMACLKNGQGELRALTDLFTSADGEVVSRSISAASAVTPIARCADVLVLKAVVRPPADSETRAQVESLRQRLSEVKALLGAGRYAEGSGKAAPIVAAARALGYDPLLAEALDALGRGKVYTGPVAEAEAALDEAMLKAEASRHDRLLAEAAVDKVGLLGIQGRIDDLNQFVPRAQATLKRIGGDSLLEGWIYSAMGTALINKGRFPESLVMHQRALEAKRRVLPPDHWDVALSVGNVASSLHSLGRNQEALEQNEHVIAILQGAFGREHPDLALHIYNRGEILLALGNIPLARADFEKALVIWKGELPPDHLYNSYALTGIGLAVLAEGKSLEEAIVPLERALKIREMASAAPEMRAETMFALARVLWQTGGDHARALRLAEDAREVFPTDKVDDVRKVTETLALWQRTDQSARTARPDQRSRIPPRP